MNEIAEEVKAIESPLPTTDESGENSSETNLVANTGVITGNDHLPKIQNSTWFTSPRFGPVARTLARCWPVRA